jgi:hypothetical protein
MTPDPTPQVEVDEEVPYFGSRGEGWREAEDQPAHIVKALRPDNPARLAVAALRMRAMPSEWIDRKDNTP